MVEVIQSVFSPADIIHPKSVLKLKFHLEIQLVKVTELKQTLVANGKLFRQLLQRSQEDDNRKLSLKKKKKKIGNFISSQPKRNSSDVYQTRSGS